MGLVTYLTCLATNGPIVVTVDDLWARPDGATPQAAAVVVEAGTLDAARGQAEVAEARPYRREDEQVTREAGTVRVVASQRESASALVLYAVIILGAAFLLPSIPATFASFWRADHSLIVLVKLGGMIVATPLLVWAIPVAVTRIAIGTGVVAAVYGRTTPGGVVIFSPLFFLGYLGRRRTFAAGDLAIRTWTVRSQHAVFPRYWLSFSQGRTVLALECTAPYEPGGRARLAAWLAAAGISTRFDGESRVLD